MSYILYSVHVDVQLSHQHFGGRPEISGFPVFAIFASWLSTIPISSCSSSDSDSSYDILTLADAADVFNANSIREFRRVSPLLLPLLFQ